jgi:coenzyme F420 hydrogenase subunit delta
MENIFFALISHRMYSLHKTNEVERVFKSVVFGCGNILLGDDGFGPCVIKELQEKYHVSCAVGLLDVGTGLREFLFDYLLCKNNRPDTLIVVDAVEFAGRMPGEIIELDPSQIPCAKIHDFSLHQFPTVNMLKELQLQTGVQVFIVAAQILSIPDTIMPGLSAEVKNALPAACEKIRSILPDGLVRRLEE